MRLSIDIDIVELAISKGLETRLRSHDDYLWTDTLCDCKYIPVNYSHSSIDFQLAYQIGHGEEMKDLSMIIYWDKRPVAIWPISISQKEGEFRISSHGLPILPPLFKQNLAHTSQKKIIKSCLSIIKDLAERYNIKAWTSSEIYQNGDGLSLWHIESLSANPKCFIQRELFLDVRGDMSEVKSNFRKSYKALISSGMKMWRVEILRTADPIIWAKFRQLHLVVSGRVTRSDKTWQIHLLDIENGTGFLVYLSNEQNEMVGAGFFNTTRDEGLYAVAAYRRDLFDKPLGHVVQYCAIEEFKARGIDWYRIGYRPYLIDTPQPSAKEISIGEFKQGFASHFFPRIVIEHLLP